MWRFILVSFGFLGLAFYEASGGSDYAPASNSLQVAMAGKPLFAPPLDLDAPVALAAADDAPAPKPRMDGVDEPAPKRTARTEMRGAERQEPVVFAGLSGISQDQLGGFGITLASVTRPLSGGDAAPQGGIESIGSFNAETLVSDVQDVPIENAVVSTRGSADIREVAGDVANMRSGPGTEYGRVDQLTRGTSVEVLGRQGAWVELRDIETGQTGWMADWLVTAAN
ncbi:SH3 domain-containing protein [Roseovarius aquimarinus]|uniref:SH3 domain-containing protein n=1 Tax=Roseovarius aquimarinus TaxID=1229156 RepID=A0ABW7I7B7_9RHOB